MPQCVTSLAKDIYQFFNLFLKLMMMLHASTRKIDAVEGENRLEDFLHIMILTHCSIYTCIEFCFVVLTDHTSVLILCNSDLTHTLGVDD